MNDSASAADFLAGVELQSAEPVREPPLWFRRALEQPRTEAHTEVDGCPVHYLEWGDREAPDLLIVHGNGAHAHWFLPTGALLADRFHCIAMTFSGMGDSGWRDYYDRDTMVKDILGVIENLGLKNPLIAAHSFGGMIAVPAAVELGDRAGGLAILDYAVEPADRVREWYTEDRPPGRPTRVYPDQQTAMARFRLLPEQSCANLWLLDFIAEKSVRPVAGGWTWKFDPCIYDHMKVGRQHERWLRSLRVPLALIYGARSVDVTTEQFEAMKPMMPAGSPLISMPQAQHHLMLDQPLAFAEVLGRVADGMLATPTRDRSARAHSLG